MKMNTVVCSIGIIMMMMVMMTFSQPLTHEAFLQGMHHQVSICILITYVLYGIDVGDGYGPETVANWAGYMHGTRTYFSLSSLRDVV
jgi:hypothetical protein